MFTEPSSDHRIFAIQTWQLYSALLQQGFNPDQALDLTRTMIQETLREGEPHG